LKDALEITRVMQKEFEHAVSELRKQYENQLKSFREALTTSMADSVSLRNQISQLHEQLADGDKHCKPDMISQVMEYRGAWLLADYRVRQLTVALSSAGIDPPVADLEQGAQIPDSFPSPPRSSSKRPWVDTYGAAAGDEDENYWGEEDFAPGERSLGPSARRV
jgi:hypothetical protein